MRTVSTGTGGETPVRFYDYLYESYLSRLLQSVKPLFPEGSRFEIRNYYNDYCLLIDWELPGKEGARPVRYRKINLLIGKDTIDKFISDQKPAWRRLVEIRLREFIAEKLRFFNPASDPSAGPRQEEPWVVTIHILGETRCGGGEGHRGGSNPQVYRLRDRTRDRDIKKPARRGFLAGFCWGGEKMFPFLGTGSMRHCAIFRP